MKLKRKTKNRGFTLIEILLVVGFISLAGIGIYTVYSKVQMSNAALTEGKNLDTIKAGVKSLYGGSQTYSGISNSVLNDARITPDSMRAIPYVAGATSITNTFGGAVTVSSVGLNGMSNNGFRVTYLNVPGAVCSKLVSGAGTNWDQITVGTALVKSFGTGNLNISSLATACSADTGSGVSIYLDSL
jgi:prepilin-type N-terminal cleavage/methylation domain-containing protein